MVTRCSRKSRSSSQASLLEMVLQTECHSEHWILSANRLSHEGVFKYRSFPEKECLASEFSLFRRQAIRARLVIAEDLDGECGGLIDNFWHALRQHIRNSLRLRCHLRLWQWELITLIHPLSKKARTTIESLYRKSCQKKSALDHP